MIYRIDEIAVHVPLPKGAKRERKGKSLDSGVD
jgi:hypothetical protein